MAAIVLVHGIAQEQYSADSLEADWLPALAGGVRNSGDPETADQLWRHSTAEPGGLGVRMAHYGDLFLTDGAQGSGAGSDAEKAGEATLDLAEGFALRILRNAAEAADDPRDRAEAARRLAVMNHDGGPAQGARAVLRPALNGLASLRWFASLGVGVAGTTVWWAISQVARYLTDDVLRREAQDRVLARIGDDTRLVIGHSLGSVVAFEALHRTGHTVSLLTLGSPLGLRNIVYDRLRPRPVTVPKAVTRWDNLVDRDDLVAARLDLTELFPASPGSTVVPVTPAPVDNGSSPHDAVHYLNKPATGRIVRSALAIPTRGVSG